MGEQPEKQSAPVTTGAEVEHRDDAVSATRKLTRATYILAGVTLVAGIVVPVIPK
jgi:hypothetical protein